MSLFIAIFLDQVLGEEIPFIGWPDGWGDFGGESEDADRRAEGGALGGAGEMVLEDIERGCGDGANAVGVIEPEGFALAVKLCAEGGMVETPTGDGAAIEVDGVGDLLIGLAEEQKTDGEALLGGKWMFAGVNFVKFWGWFCVVSVCKS